MYWKNCAAKTCTCENSRNAEGKIIPPEKRQDILNELRQNYFKKVHHKISKLLNNSTALKFVRRKWIEVNDLLNSQYSTNKNIGLKTPMIRSDLCGYSDAYFVLNRTTNLRTGASNDMLRKEVKLENNAHFRSCQGLF